MLASLCNFDHHEAYWSVEDGGLLYCPTPFDELDFEVEIYDESISISELAQALHDERSRLYDTAYEWKVCGHNVYFRPDFLHSKWHLVAVLFREGGRYLCCQDDPEKPLDIEVRRMVNRGCDHPKRCCVHPEDVAERHATP